MSEPQSFTTRRPDRAARRAAGAARRVEVPLEAHASLPSPADRRDAVSLLREQEGVREPVLVPLRYQRMTAEPFAFLRGAAAVMASDLSLVPASGISTQLCGDAHLANFGMFASTERTLVFDLNDFDETLPGPFEWDVKRLAASIVVAGRSLGLSDKRSRRAAVTGVRSYRETMGRLAEMTVMAAWTSRLDASTLTDRLRRTSLRKAVVKATGKSGRSNSATATVKLTETVDGARHFRTEPPVLLPIPPDEFLPVIERLGDAYRDYLTTIPSDLVALLDRYSFVDLAHKVVGVGSVGTRALVLLLETGDGEPLVLQLKQANASVLEPYLSASQYAHAGRRVVSGQKAMQAAGDPFLGWCRGSEHAPYDFYVRQLNDQKSSIDLSRLDEDSLPMYAAICGAVLARAHARVGDAAIISGYLGINEEFDHAVAAFADGYADITAHDHAELVSRRPAFEEATT